MSRPRIGSFGPDPLKRVGGLSATARATGVTSATLVYWEEIGLLRPARTRLGRRRMYFPADLDRIRQIKWLRYSELLTLEGVKRRLEAPRDQEVYDWPVRSRGMTIDDSKGPADAPSLAP